VNTFGMEASLSLRSQVIELQQDGMRNG
jgi:hypothetical protein